MNLEGIFLIQLTSNFVSRLACHLAVNGRNDGVKNKILKNGLILTGKKCVVKIYKRKQHTQNHIDWIKKEVQILYNLIPGSS